MALVEKPGRLRFTADHHWFMSSGGSTLDVSVGPSYRIYRDSTNAPYGFAMRAQAGQTKIYAISGRETGGSVTVSGSPRINLLIDDGAGILPDDPSRVAPFNCVHHLAGDPTGGSDPSVPYPGQTSPQNQAYRMDGWAKNLLRGATLAPIHTDAAYQSNYGTLRVEGLGVRHHPSLNNHSRTINTLTADLSNKLREGATLFATVSPAEVASGGYRNFWLRLGGVLPEPAEGYLDVVFFRQDSDTSWQWYPAEDKLKAWEYAVAAMQQHIRMLERIFKHVQTGSPASSHPEWAVSGVRPVDTTSQWLTVEQLETCDAWWAQVLDLRTHLQTVKQPAAVIDEAEASEDPVEYLDEAGYEQNGSSAAELYDQWKKSGSQLPFTEWLKTAEAGFGGDSSTGFLDAVKGGAAWLGDNVVDIVKDWGATGTLGFLAGAKVITDDELPPWLLPVGIGVLAFLVLK